MVLFTTLVTQTGIEPDTAWYEPILAFGADVQRTITGGYTFAENIEAGYLPYSYRPTTDIVNKASLDFAKYVSEGFTKNVSEPLVGAGKTLTEFSENLQAFSYNLQKGSSEFFKTGGNFLDRLSGGQGLFSQLGAALPFIAIGLIALVVLVRK